MLPPAARRSALALLIVLPACGARTERTVPAAVTPDWTERGAWTDPYELESPGSDEYPPFLGAQAPMAREFTERVRLGGRVPLQPTLLLLHPDGVAGDRGTIGHYSDRPPRDETAMFAALLARDIEAARRHGITWVQVHADRRVPWERISRWIQILGRDPPGVSTFRFRFPAAPGRHQGGLVAELRRTTTPSLADVRLHALTSGLDPEIAVEEGESTWRFPEGPPYTGEDRVRRANEHWRAIHAALQARRTTDRRPLDLDVQGEVPWGYVVQVISIAAVSGTTRVALPQAALELVMRLEEGDAGAALAVRRVADGAPLGLAPVVWILVGLLSWSLAGALLFRLGSRRRPAGRRSPDRTAGAT